MAEVLSGAPREDVRYSGFNPKYINSVDFKMLPHRMYLTAERALNKDEQHSVLSWRRGYTSVEHNLPPGSNYIFDSRGEVVRIPDHKGRAYQDYLGWLRVDELNVPLNIVPLKYYTVQKRDQGKRWTDILADITPSIEHVGVTRWEAFEIWNTPKHHVVNNYILDIDIGKTYITDMGFPPTSDANLFRNEQLENNRYQNANQSQMVSVKLQGRPNTRYIASTSASRNPTSNNHEVFIGLYPSEPDQSIGFSVNEDMVFITDHKGEIELSFYDSGLSGVNADYLDFLDYTYWVEILVHPNQIMTVPPDMTIQAGNANYGVFNGDNLESGLELKPGINEITITGKGKISFHWNDEVMG